MAGGNQIMRTCPNCSTDHDEPACPICTAFARIRRKAVAKMIQQGRRKVAQIKSYAELSQPKERVEETENTKESF
jgi:hypothetical protein